MTVVVPLVAEVDRSARRSRIRGVAGVDGIDIIDVLSNHTTAPGHISGAPQQRTLVVYLVNGPAPSTWNAGAVRIIGGVREDPDLNPVGVQWAFDAVRVAGLAATPPDLALPAVTAEDRALVAQEVPEAYRERAFVVRTTSSGDWSTYRLRLVGPSGVGAPGGIDVPLSVAPFTFTVDCPADDDCAPARERPPTPEAPLPGDYLARDYEALRVRLLDRLSTLMPQWSDRSPADPAVMLVELFAAVGDRLSSWQDAAAAEGYLTTARRRTSVRRHARLLDYAVHEGCAARTLLAFHTDTDLTLAAGTAVTDLAADVELASRLDAVDLDGLVFEAAADCTITTERNALPLYAWGDAQHCLPPGSTAAFVTSPAGTDPLLAEGDLLVLAERPIGGEPHEGDPSRRYAVRLAADPVRYDDPVDAAVWVWELRWAGADALPGPLRVTVAGTEDAVSVALANVVLADHGARIVGDALVPPTVEPGARRPRLGEPGIAYIDADYTSARSAAGALSPDPRTARAWLRLDDGARVWTPRPDLIASGPLAPHVVVEPEAGGVARLRFGDGVTGRAPVPGVQFSATYRVGGGERGNIAPDRLHRILPAVGGADPVAGATVTAWNPLPARGGVDPERIEQVKQLAPSAFRRQLRAVTTADYAVVAQQHPGVQRAVARRRWSGSWYAQVVTLDPVAAHADDPLVRAEVLAALGAHRMAGIDVALEKPVFVALRLRLTGCVRPGALAAEIEARLREVFISGLRRDGTQGFFHPDRFTFGDALRLSDVVAAAMAVDGLAWVDVEEFARAGASPFDAALSLTAGVLEMSPREVLRCDSDPSNPENGRIEIDVRGGS